jgi:hypothetical protein
VRPVLLAVAAAALLAVSATAAAPLPGTKTPKDRAAWRAILHWPADCERDWRTGGHAPTSRVQVWRTAAGTRLVGVTCYVAAYQSTTRFYLVDANRRVRPLTFHIYADPGSGKPTPAREQTILGVLDFARKTGKLSLFDKARGPGDCGINSVFRLAGDRFVPVETRAKTACDGKPPYDPRRWPKLPTLSP